MNAEYGTEGVCLDGNLQCCDSEDRDDESKKPIDGFKFGDGAHSKTFPREA